MKKTVDVIDKKFNDVNDYVDYLIEVELPEPSQDSFLKVCETLTRIGISSNFDESTLYQTCHLLQKKGKHYICHFKTMFCLDGKSNNLTRGDIARQNRIAMLLDEWGLVIIKDKSVIGDVMAGMANIMVVPFNESKNWSLVPKYQFKSRK